MKMWGIFMLIRTFLSRPLLVEIEGHWSWRGMKE